MWAELFLAGCVRAENFAAVPILASEDEQPTVKRLNIEPAQEERPEPLSGALADVVQQQLYRLLLAAERPSDELPHVHLPIAVDICHREQLLFQLRGQSHVVLAACSHGYLIEVLLKLVNSHVAIAVLVPGLEMFDELRQFLRIAANHFVDLVSHTSECASCLHGTHGVSYKLMIAYLTTSICVHLLHQLKRGFFDEHLLFIRQLAVLLEGNCCPHCRELICVQDLILPRVLPEIVL
mmetsp:Transcript_78372/g.196782  ORF Transcript_78372/g.196782 Transcript_78372/m.196782 type:complete len:237 (-) Transcript_78372:117-827(-)